MICFGRHILRIVGLWVVLTIVGSLSSCRHYVGDEHAVGAKLAEADSLRYEAPTILFTYGNDNFKRPRYNGT